MSETIYLVSAGSYSDYGVLALYDNHSDAHAFMTYWNVHGHDEEARIETYPLNPYRERVKRNLPMWMVTMTRTGDSDVMQANPAEEKIQVMFEPSETYDKQRRLRIFLAAKDEWHAAKIANERRAQLIANGGWNETHNE